jgi:prevent-host-death family protein
MKSMSAKDAKNNFGVLMDDVQHEPVSIKKHGRPFAVVLSVREYKELKLRILRDELQKAEDQLDQGKCSEYTYETLMAELDMEFSE